jgi:3-dehydroquinate synthase
MNMRGEMTDLNQPIDVVFSANYRQRVYFTDDLLQTDKHVLSNLMRGPDGAPGKAIVCVDRGLVDACPEILERIEAFAGYHSDRVMLAGDVVFVPSGESCKRDFTAVDAVLAAINRAALDRRSFVIAVGGGAVLDAVGFAAAIAHRGTRLIRVPTTSLAQADVGVGVKNSVNCFDKKNFLGTYAVPWAVINDAALLRTLADRDFRAGFAEVVKVALLKDPGLFFRVHDSADLIVQRDTNAVRATLRRAAELHLAHITTAGDPFETTSSRPLDFGHWSAHRLESLSNFTLTHGEAVAIGVAIDSMYSLQTRGMPSAHVDAVLDCLSRLGFELGHPLLMDSDCLLIGIEEFRQHMGGDLAITLLDDIGCPVEVSQVDVPAMRNAIRHVAGLVGRPQEPHIRRREVATQPGLSDYSLGDVSSRDTMPSFGQAAWR